MYSIAPILSPSRQNKKKKSTTCVIPSKPGAAWQLAYLNNKKYLENTKYFKIALVI